MNRQEQDYNAGYRQAIEDMEELMLQLHDYRQAISTEEMRDLGCSSREFADGYHDALQKLYGMFNAIAQNAPRS